MFTAMLLVCSLEGLCLGMAGPVRKTLDDCMDSIPLGLIAASERYPDMIVYDAKCVAWGEPA
jgi:hypothetical protein